MDAALIDRPITDRIVSLRCAPVAKCGIALRDWFICCGIALVAIASGIAPALGQIVQVGTNRNDRIAIAADVASHWQQGAYEVWLLRGHCYINQGLTYARSQQAVLWIRRGDPRQGTPTKVIAHLEGSVTIDDHRPTGADASPGPRISRLADRSWFGRFHTFAPLNLQLPDAEGEPAVKPAIYQRGMARFDPEWGHTIRRTEFTAASSGPAPIDALPPGTRRLQVFPRSGVAPQAQLYPTASGNEWIIVIGPGVNLVVSGLDNFVEGMGTIGKIDVSADRLVVWTSGAQPDLSGSTVQSRETPLEIYMEGNIVFRQGERVIYAKQMYYDVRQQIGVVLDAEMLTPVPEYQGLVRLRAGVLRQISANRFVGQDAAITASRLADPSYDLRSRRIEFEDTPRPAIDPRTGAPQVDPQTGELVIDHQRMVTSQNNFLYLGSVPILYWPTMATDLEKPNYYVDAFAIKSDNIFGNQIELGLDAYQLLGIRNAPAGTDWNLNFDYMSDRGFGYGTTFQYDRPSFLTLPGPTIGKLDAWLINDGGIDNLGRLRRTVPPETDARGRAYWKHRQQLQNNFTVTAEAGWISDRNFLEGYYEDEWDEWKDQTTDIELKQTYDNKSWSLFASARVNDFLTQTEWLPRLDHFWLGQPLLDNRLTWFEHTNLGYARMQAAVPPTDPQQLTIWKPLPWETNVQGERFVTRQELDLPIQAGVVKLVPYALGELAHWGEVLDGQPTDRAYFQTGLRASIPLWAVNPTVENHLLNVHGMAHKVVFDFDASYADANRDLDEFPLYDPINDNSIQAFERQYPFTTFGLPFAQPLPGQFDPRSYALRSGMQGWVASPSTEIVDDLSAVRM
ncbi:MAG: hypothetical protein ACC645_10950, partial [Pirellulales bacterium]